MDWDGLGGNWVDWEGTGMDWEGIGLDWEGTGRELGGLGGGGAKPGRGRGHPKPLPPSGVSPLDEGGVGGRGLAGLAPPLWAGRGREVGGASVGSSSPSLPEEAEPSRR